MQHSKKWENAVTAAQRKRLTGGMGIGRSTRGLEDHSRAKLWTLKSPDGETINVSNLREWCRKNEDRFEGAELITSAHRPIWKRASQALSKIACGTYDGDSYFGWTVLANKNL